RPAWLARHRFACAVGLALAVHLALLALAAARQDTARTPGSVRSAPGEHPLLEFELLGVAEAEPTHGAVELAAFYAPPPDASFTAAPSRALSAPAPSASTSAPAVVAAVSEAAAVDTGVEPGAEADASEAPAAATARKQVRLYLGPKDLAEFARRPAAAERPSAPSVARLPEEAEARDAERGLSRSSAAVSACYRSAQLGPEVGTALLEVRTDARGAVTSVRLLGDSVTDAWFVVADDLMSQLKGRLLRVPVGARGLVTRLRVDRGNLAEELSERGRLERGVAIGQDHHEKDYGWDESTQGSMTGKRPTPSLGLSSESLRKKVKTRVRLVSQEFL